MSPPWSAAVEALIAYERIVVSKPEIVRARVLARARESLRSADLAGIEPSRASVRIRWVLFAAAAGVLLTASVAVALQVILRPGVTPTPVGRASQHLPVVPPPSEAEASIAPTLAPKTIPAFGDLSTGISTPKTSALSHRVNPAGKEHNGIEEIRLLELARQSDARGDYASVLGIADDHERSYRDGRLAEEREVLRVKALVGLGRGDDARHVAARFRRQFPRSVLLQTIEDMLAALP
jgi:hypothetical protein